MQKNGFWDQMYFAIYRPICKGNSSENVTPIRGGKSDLLKALKRTGATSESVNNLMARTDEMKYLERCSIVDPKIGIITIECRRKYRK